ncbi:MAG: translocation/assembly module TamB domain-containing protein, partial [Pseudomonadota bacterium]|nr:translocation/assembly module TamB domain-containing protein [Pseudomonadota bacterium]
PISLRVDVAPVSGISAGGGLNVDTLELDGSFDLKNLAPATVNSGGVPLQAAGGKVSWRKDDVRLANVVFDLLGNGRARGDARWHAGTLTAKLALSDVDLARLDTRLQPTHLSGPVTLDAGTKTQTISAQLQDPRFEVALDVRREGERVEVTHAQVSAKSARLDASGWVMLDAGRAFSVKGKLASFDPSLYVRGPKASLNATFEAKGNWKGEPQASVELALSPSTLRGYPVHGQASLAISGERVVARGVDLNLAGNTIHAEGAYGRPSDALAFAIDAPALGRIDPSLSGTVRAHGRIVGTVREPHGELHAQVRELRLPGNVRAATGVLDARFEGGLDGKVDGTAQVSGLAWGSPQWAVQSANLRIAGTRRKHALDLDATLERGTHITLAANGGIEPGQTWRGTLARLTAQGEYDIRLADPVALEIAKDRVTLGNAQLVVQGARIDVARAQWSPGAMSLKASFADLAPARFAKAKALQSTTLVLQGSADLRLTRMLEGSVEVQRQSGDVRLPDEPAGLGLRDLEARLTAHDGSVDVTWRTSGERLGALSGTLHTRLAPGQLAPAASAPLSGRGEAHMASIKWIGPLVDPNLAVDGRINAAFTLSGTVGDPRVSGEVIGSDLDVAWVERGIRLTGGAVHIALDGTQARLTQFEFASPIRVRPGDSRIPASQYEQPGKITASGEYDLATRRGEIRIDATRVAALQQKDEWAVVSGDLKVTIAPQKIAVTGDLTVPAAYWELAGATDAPRLSSDVVVVRHGEQTAAPTKLNVDMQVAVTLGPHVYLHGKGLDTRLAGSLRIRTDDSGNVRATGSVQTAGGTYDAYGQKLAVERGIINFQGPIDDPGLNVRAVRRGIPLEAGIEIRGTVKNPRVALYSNPPLSDSEKLAWIVLGRPAEQAGDIGVLASAAAGLFGGTGEGIPQRLAKNLGLEFSMSTGDLTGANAALPTSKVVGTSSSAGEFGTNQILVLGRKLSSKLSLAVEYAIGGEGAILRLTYALTRRISLVARAGADNALDILYTFAWD